MLFLQGRAELFSAWTNRLGDREERRPSSLDRSSPNKMPLSDLLLLLPSCYSPPSNNLQRVWAYIIKGAISPISSEIPRFGEKSYICTRPRSLSQEIITKENFVETTAGFCTLATRVLMRRNGTCQEIRNCCDIHIPLNTNAITVGLNTFSIWILQ